MRVTAQQTAQCTFLGSLSMGSCWLQMNYQNKDALMGAMIVAGYDKHEGGQVYGVPIGGTVVREPWAVDGSGSTYIWGYMDNDFR